MRNLYIVWRDYQRRAEVVAPLLDAELVFLPHKFRSRWGRPADYLLKLILTALLIIRRRPDFVVLQTPPPFAAIAALLVGVPYVLDAHNATFQGRWARVPGSAAVLRRARVVVAHNDDIAAHARSLFPGTRILSALDPVPVMPGAGAPDGRDPCRILLVCSFAADEPIQVILDVISGAPEFTFFITADPRKLSKDARTRLTSLPNVELTGFLPTEAYQHVLATSRAALVLSTRAHTQPSGACEALASDTPLVLSRTPLTERLFGSWAMLVNNHSSEILAALRKPEQRPHDLAGERQRWNEAVQRALAEVATLAGPPRPRQAVTGTE
jgi:glycosyltransferase involved in cell wall biosynthesis